MSIKLNEWVDSLTASQKKHLSAAADMTLPYLISLLKERPSALKLTVVMSVVKFAEELGVELTIDDFREVV